MTIVNYIDHDGTAHEVDVPNGDSVMQGAVDNAVEAILGECGGGLACATCLCFVEPEWRDRVGDMSDMEKEMLEFSAHGSEPGARLSCQITVTDALEGLVVRLPESQY